jgi:hypothetical protein
MFNECRHILTGGDRCHAAALRNQPYCYFHNKLHRLSSPSGETKPIPMPPIEDDSSIKLALNQIFGALNSPHMDTRRASLMLYGLQIAAQLTGRSLPTPSHSVRNLSRQRDGSELAPSTKVCEPPEDCPDCQYKDECLNIDRVNYRSVARILNAYRKGQDNWDQRDRAKVAQAAPAANQRLPD